ncbi:ADP-ribose pyrophosphatase, mitochondrial, partial [Stegodyphus mimosarum]
MNSICRISTCYPVLRLLLSDEKVPWHVSFPDYSPPNYSAPHLLKSSWADPDINDENFQPKWNQEDGGIDRRSFDQNKQIKYDVVNGYPLNPRGRTGLSGRGRLGRWGPNHAVDAVVTRWKRVSSDSSIVKSKSGLPILQFIAIQRKDCGEWAIPGGFKDPNEASSTAVLRELLEEAINFEKLSEEAKKAITDFFKTGKQVYKGYVDDPRNTDNAWIETTAYNFHDETGKSTENIVLDARDDAADAKWIDIVEDMKIYPTHNDIIRSVFEMHLKSNMN